MISVDGGGEYANVASNWLMWTFKKDIVSGAVEDSERGRARPIRALRSDSETEDGEWSEV
jgi:hypothetical protein